MKNVKLSGIFLAMVAEFGTRGFEVTSIVPDYSIEPIDALITFKGCDMTTFNLSKANDIVKENIDMRDVLQVLVNAKQDSIEVYLEFIGSRFLDSLD